MLSLFSHRAFEVLVLSALVVSSGCIEESVGALCKLEGDCEAGLRCLKSDRDNDMGVCTVRCDSERPCQGPESVCVQVGGSDASYGFICLQGCEADDECDTRREAQNGPFVKLRCAEVTPFQGFGGPELACYF